MTTRPLVINILVIWLIHLLCQLYHTASPGAIIFNIGLLTGIAILFYPPAYILLLVMFLGILIIRPFRFTQVVTYLIGAFLPLYFLGAYLYLHGAFADLSLYLPKLGWHRPSLENKGTLTGSFILILICVTGGFTYLQSGFHKLLILARKCWIILCLMLICLIPTVFTVAHVDWTVLLLMMPACAGIAGNLFYYNQQKILLSVIFWLLIFSAWFYTFNGWQWLPAK